MNETAIVGVGFTPLVRKTDRTLGSLALEAALNAIGDAGLQPRDIDGYAGTPTVPGLLSTGQADGIGMVSAHYVLRGLGLPVRWISDAARGMVSDSMINAVHALAYGSCTYALIVRAMVNPVGVRYWENRVSAVAGPDQFTAPYGQSPIAQFALLLRRYLHEYGATKAELYHVAKTLRDHAQLNPYAYWRGTPLSEADYLGARAIADPMALYDCDIPLTGAGAIVLTTADRARHLRHKPGYITAFATSWEGPREIYRKGGIAPQDVGCAQLYDGYLSAIWYWLEELEFCGRGEAHAFALDGRIALGGALPVSTFGGSQGEGRLNGMGHLREGALQIMGRAGPRQVPNLHHCLVTLGIQYVPGAVFLLAAEPN